LKYRKITLFSGASDVNNGLSIRIDFNLDPAFHLNPNYLANIFDKKFVPISYQNKIIVSKKDLLFSPTFSPFSYNLDPDPIRIQEERKSRSNPNPRKNIEIHLFAI
jgi:hypothetical protein